MTESTRPKRNPFKYAAVLLGAAAIAAAPLASPAIASAQKYWDIEEYDDCLQGFANSNDQINTSINAVKRQNKACCEGSGGIFIDDGYIGKCVAPPGEPASGSRQFPGNAQIPSDIAIAPVTNAPPRPIQVPSDIATVSTVS
jgi:hypothetical protein